jgi:hypothetical protein
MDKIFRSARAKSGRKKGRTPWERKGVCTEKKKNATNNRKKRRRKVLLANEQKPGLPPVSFYGRR